MRGFRKIVSVLLTIIAIILVVKALQVTQVITMPLAFAFFILLLIRPFQRSLNRRVPKLLSLTIVLFVLTTVFAAFLSVIWFCIGIVAPQFPEYADRLQQIFGNLLTWLEQQGISAGDASSLQNSLGQFLGQALAGVDYIWTGLSFFVVTVALLVLLLIEVEEYRQKVERGFPTHLSKKLLSASETMGYKFRRYFVIVTFTSFLTGVLTALLCWILGLNLAFVWGLLSFILNYVPTLGSIIAILVISLFALAFSSLIKSLIIFIGLVLIQVTLGYFIDPRLQGHSVKLSPFVVLISLVFWGWVWGIGGALLGAPMTIAIAAFCMEFDRLKPIALFVSETAHPDFLEKDSSNSVHN